MTLEAVPDMSCVGMAYRIEAHQQPEALRILDHRESGGYERHRVTLAFDEPASQTDGWVYIAGHGNPNYVGPQSLEAIAQIVASAHGPSGANMEYVLRLAEALRELGAEDSEIFELERLLLDPPRSVVSLGGSR